MSEVDQVNLEMSALTTKDFFISLKERVSAYHANLLLNSALFESGLRESSANRDQLLNKDEVKTLCLSLIKRGGPAFQVGQTMYRKILN